MGFLEEYTESIEAILAEFYKNVRSCRNSVKSSLADFSF